MNTYLKESLLNSDNHYKEPTIGNFELENDGGGGGGGGGGGIDCIVGGTIAIGAATGGGAGIAGAARRKKNYQINIKHEYLSYKLSVFVIIVKE